MRKVETTDILVIGGDQFFESATCTLSSEDEFNIQQGQGLLEYNKNIHSITYRFKGEVEFSNEGGNQIEVEYGRIFDINYLTVESGGGVTLVLNEKHNVEFEIHLSLTV
jgi:hypothetical protein